jgi:multidrug resistance efflux pump
LDTTENKHPIPTPFPLLLRRVRYQVVPALTLVTCLILAGWLWVRRGGSVTAIGSVNAIQAPVNAKIDGLLVNLPADRKVQIFDTVSAGEVVARLDTSQIVAQIERETERLNEVRRQLEMFNKIKPRNPTTAPSTGTQAAPADASAVAVKGIAARPLIARTEPAETDNDNNDILTNPLLQNKFSLEMLAKDYQTKIAELEQRILAQDIKAPISGRSFPSTDFPARR